MADLNELVLAADIGGSKIRVGLFDQELRLLRSKVVPTPKDPAPESIPSVLIEVSKEVASDVLGKLVSFGIASMGPLDLKKGMIVKTPTVGTRCIPLIEILRDWLDVEYYLLNDCTAAAYAEWYSMRKDAVNSLAYVTISSGIGGGAVVDGCLLMGRDGNAAEIGHTVIDPSGYMRCGCGGYGHWEAYCSGVNMPRYAIKLFNDGLLPADSALTAKMDNDSLSSEMIFELYEMGDVGARTLLKRVAAMNAAGISSVISCYDPEVLVMGGAVVLNHFDYFENEVFPQLDKYLCLERPRITLPIHGELSPLMGAALVAKHRFEKALVV